MQPHSLLLSTEYHLIHELLLAVVLVKGMLTRKTPVAMWMTSFSALNIP